MAAVATTTTSGSSARVASPQVPRTEFGGLNIDVAIISQQQAIEKWTNTVMAETIQWEAYQRASLITQREYEMIRAYDKKPAETRAALLAQAGSAYAELMLNMLQNLAKEDVVLYVLVLIDQIFAEDPQGDRLHEFIATHHGNEHYPLGPLLRLLERFNTSDWFANYLTCKILVRLAMALPMLSTEETSTLFRWLNEQLRKNDIQDVGIALKSLMTLLRRDEFRLVFAKVDGVGLLSTILNRELHTADINQKNQFLYELINCVWLLTFNASVCETISNTALVAGLVEAMRVAQKEKVIRMCLASLVNLLDKHKCNEDMIMAGIEKAIKSLKRRNFGDEDMDKDLEKLEEGLQKNLAVLSTFDRYKAEVLSGQLEWTPVHKSDKFWKENITKFEEQNFRLIYVLLQIIQTSNDATQLCIALQDIGEFVRFHPRGRNVVDRAQGKEPIMSKMMHPDGEVQKQALFCTQKLMVTKWEHLTV